MYFTHHSYGVPLFMGFGAGVAFLAGLLILIGFAILIALKGYALWYAAKRDEKWWFIGLLVINTAGILELVYLIWFVKRWPQLLPKKEHQHTEGEHNHTHDHNHDHSTK